VRSYAVTGDMEGALDALAARTAERPEDAVAHKLMGDLLFQQEKRDEAVAAYRQAMHLKPDWLVPYHALADRLWSIGAYDDAAETLRAALEQKPDDVDLLMKLAVTREKAERFDEALETYDKVLALDPRNEIAANNFAAVVADHRNDDAAMMAKALERAQRFRTSDRPAFLDTLGWVYYRKGEPAVALAFIERAATLRPDIPEFRYHLGMALYRTKQPDQARAALEAAVAVERDYLGKEEARAILAELEGRPPAKLPEKAVQGEG
jgi:Flp pilus assembly protein TadD